MWVQRNHNHYCSDHRQQFTFLRWVFIWNNPKWLPNPVPAKFLVEKKGSVFIEWGEEPFPFIFTSDVDCPAHPVYSLTSRTRLWPLHLHSTYKFPHLEANKAKLSGGFKRRPSEPDKGHRICKTFLTSPCFAAPKVTPSQKQVTFIDAGIFYQTRVRSNSLPFSVTDSNTHLELTPIVETWLMWLWL